MLWKAPAFAVLVVAWMLAASLTPAWAQTPDTGEQEEEDDRPFDRACMDDYGRDLCDQSVWGEIVARFGLEPAELVQSKGMRGIRAFTIDGYSMDKPAVSILSAGRDKSGRTVNGRLEVRRQTAKGESKTGPAVLEREAWSGLFDWVDDLQAIVAASPERQPEEDIKRVTETGNIIVSICSHAWVTVTESLTDEGVTRRIRNGCGSDPVFEASFAMSGRALLGFPYCTHLDPANHRNESTQLARCFSLDGPDKIAAADVATIFDSSIEVATDLEPYLAPDVRLLRSGRAAFSGPSSVKAVLADPAFAEFDLNAGLLVGEGNRVVASGWLDRYIDDGSEVADVEITWRRTDNTWRIVTITVGPLKTEKW